MDSPYLQLDVDLLSYLEHVDFWYSQGSVKAAHSGARFIPKNSAPIPIATIAIRLIRFVIV